MQQYSNGARDSVEWFLNLCKACPDQGSFIYASSMFEIAIFLKANSERWDIAEVAAALKDAGENHELLQNILIKYIYLWRSK